MKWFLTAIAAVAAYLVWPYVALWQIDRALQSRDLTALESIADWPALRASIKADWRAETVADNSKQIIAGLRDSSAAGVVGSLLGSALGGAAVDTIIDGMISPQMLAKAINDGAVFRDHDPVEFVRYAFFSSPTVFRLDLSNPKNDVAAAPLTLLLTLSGGSWKISRLLLDTDLSKYLKRPDPKPTTTADDLRGEEERQQREFRASRGATPAQSGSARGR